jgi:hypothetical protein
MTFKTAEAGFRKALIPLLGGGRTIGPTQSLFAQIFESKILFPERPTNTPRKKT